MDNIVLNKEDAEQIFILLEDAFHVERVNSLEEWSDLTYKLSEAMTFMTEAFEAFEAEKEKK